MTAQPSPSPEAERVAAQSAPGDAPPDGGVVPGGPAPESVVPEPVVVPEPEVVPVLEPLPVPVAEPLPVPEAAGAEPPGSPGAEAPGSPGAEAAGETRQEAGGVPVARVRLDARLLEATLLNLRKRIAAIPLVFDISGAEEVSAERGKILSQIDDYLLPRVRQSAAPILVALVGSTGAGKSTLVNSIVGTQVSQTGVRRPTTNSPVLACHPDDIHWFAENMFLPTLPRVRQEGLARPGRDGLLVLAAVESMTRGFALLDTPDIDSVAHSHREFAYQFLDAADLWLFMTSSNRYADAPVWEILQHARERGAALGIVLSRVPRSHHTELVSHFNAMLDANGITASKRFVIPDTAVMDNMLPPEVYQPVKDWLAETAQQEDRRVAVLSQTMAGVLDTFKIRVPKLAAHVDAQVALRTGLRRRAETEYADTLTAFDASAREAALLRGEVLARWQDCADSGDLGAALSSRRQSRKGRRARKGTGNARVATLDAALRAAIEGLVVSVADRAAEKVSAAWRAEPAGATLLAGVEAIRAREEKAERELASAFGPAAGSGPGKAFDAESTAWAANVAAGFRAASAAARGVTTTGSDQAAERPVHTLDRSSPDLPARTARAIGAWQDQLMRLLSSARGDDLPYLPGHARSKGKAIGHAAQDAANQTASWSHDSEPLILMALIAVLGEGAASSPGAFSSPGAAGSPDATGQEILQVPREVLARSLGASKVDSLLTQARADLNERVRLLLDEELLRFVEILEATGPVDPVAAVRLYQAEYNLEAVR